MGIDATFTGDFTAIDLDSLADDLLAEVVADHAAQRFSEKNRANAVVAGGYVPYTVAIDGRTVSRGQGEIMPKAALVAAMPGRVASRAVIDFAWLWERLNGTALERAIGAFMRADATLRQIQSAGDFARLVLNARDDSTDLFRFLFLKYVSYRYPQVGHALGTLKEARRYYRIYRRIKLADRLLLGGGKGDASDADPEVLAWIAAELRNQSPVQSGEYRDAHELYADGEVIANADEVSEDMDLPDAEEFSFTNTLPYARKIEMGKTKAGRDFVIQVPPHIYERVADDARAQFGDVAEIRFEMRAVLGGEQVRQSKAASTRPPRAASGVRESRLGRVHGQTAHNNPDVRYPTIIVRFQ